MPLSTAKTSPVGALSTIALTLVLASGATAWYLNAAATPLKPPLVDLDAEAATPAGPDPALLARELDLAERPPALRRQVQVGRGDTLMGLLVEAGVERREAHAAITALTKSFSPRDLKPGQVIELDFAATGRAPGSAGETAGDEPLRLAALSLQPGPDRELHVRREGQEGGFTARSIDRPLTRRYAAASGAVVSSLFIAGRESEVPDPVMVDLIRMFSFDVDFQREVQPGDTFELLYERYNDVTGNLAKTGDILLATLTLSGQRIELTRFTPASGRSDYFDAKGRSVRKTLMRTPIDGARLSSGFGRRKHPILGYTKMHRGVDFAAPRGTPIYAAGDGTIEHAGRKGAYGKYIRIRHNSTYKTAYAHMSRLAKGMRRGKRVKQGQVIGYVGSTGRSTGPHLHYEIMVGGKQVNPRRIKMPSGEVLKGADLEAFETVRAETRNLYAQAAAGAVIAGTPCGPRDSQSEDPEPLPDHSATLAPASDGC